MRKNEVAVVEKKENKGLSKVKKLIAKKAWRGSISYKRPAKIVSTAVDQLSAKAEYRP